MRHTRAPDGRARAAMHGGVGPANHSAGPASCPGGFLSGRQGPESSPPRRVSASRADDDETCEYTSIVSAMRL
jgi:hypothetical protein